MTTTGCDSAAAALGLSVTSSAVDFGSGYPGGCFSIGNYAAYVNTGTTVSSCTTSYQCLCRTPDTCSNTEGASINPTDCMCGNKICDTDEGRFCQSSLNKCSKSAVCTTTDGSVANSNECACGTADCD